jgi:thiamine transporter
MDKKNLKVLTESAIMLALAFALSSAKLFEMPLGGSVTVASMLPIMLISFKWGNKAGLITAFLYSITQALQALASGNVFPYCEGIDTLIICIVFDYIFPFTILGLAGVFYGKFRSTNVDFVVGACAVVFLRFCSHFLTGVYIWGQWAPEGMGKYLYSFLYNGGFLGVDFAILLVVLVLMLKSEEIKKLIERAK